jgi:hypothetical protein
LKNQVFTKIRQSIVARCIPSYYDEQRSIFQKQRYSIAVRCIVSCCDVNGQIFKSNSKPSQYDMIPSCCDERTLPINTSTKIHFLHQNFTPLLCSNFPRNLPSSKTHSKLQKPYFSSSSSTLSKPSTNQISQQKNQTFS